MPNPLRTLGPKVDTTTGTTLAYTLGATEHVDIGETLLIAIGGAGTGGAHAISATDTKGNSYQVDAFENTSGSAVATALSCSPSTQLVAGDTITLTFGASNSDRVFFGRIVNGVLTTTARVEDFGTAGMTGSGSTAPAVTIGVKDGVGTGTQISANDYEFVVTVWNGTAALTRDTALDPVWTGHFDNTTGAQVKQMDVAEKIPTGSGVKSYTGTLDHTQPWAMIAVAYFATTVVASDTLGPHQETGGGQTITYTLAAGESVVAGQTPIIALTCAGAGGATAISAADSQGNAYTVDQIDQPSGTVATSILSGRISRDLHAGDTITVTVQNSSNTVTNRNMAIRLVDGLVVASRVDQTSAVNGTGAGPFELRTGVIDGVGAPTAIVQGDEYAFVVQAWNGTPTITRDAALTRVLNGHFDYAAGTQVKQFDVSEHIFGGAPSVKFFDNSLSATTTGYSACMVTYKIATGAPPTGAVKTPPRGLAGRDIAAPPSGYLNSFHHMQFRVYWNIIQPTQPDGTFNENILDPQEVSRISSLLDSISAMNRTDGAKYTGGIRLFAGDRSPDWLKARTGTFRYKDPQGGTNPVITVPKYWTAAFLNAWDNLQALMAAEWDGHPALHMLQLANAMTFYAEEFIHHIDNDQNRAEMVGGGNRWNLDGTVSSTFMAAPGAGYSDAANEAAIRHGLDTHAANWPNTPASISYNPYDVLLSQTEAQVSNPGIQYGSPINNQIFSHDDSVLTRTKRLIDYHVATLAPTNRCVLENNSVRSSYFLAGGAIDTSQKIGKMYSYFVTKGVPLYYQLAAEKQVGDFNAAMQGTVGALKGNAAEPSTNQGATGTPYTPTNLASWDAALYANPVPIYTSPPPPPGPPPPPPPPPPGAPTVVITAPTNLLSTSAQLNGTVNPNSAAVTDYHFEYGTTTAYGQTTAGGTIPSGAAPVAVANTISGLTPGVTYHARLVATNASGTSVSADRTFVPGAGGTHAPNNIGAPAITNVNNTSWAPGTLIRTSMGSWDSGSQAITNYAVTWFRVDPASGGRTAIRGPTNYASGTATDAYTIGVGDVADQIISEVVAVNATNPSGPADSNPTPTIQSTSGAAPGNTAPPSIVPNQPYRGSVLTGLPGSWTGQPIEYQFQFQISLNNGGTWTVVQALGLDDTYSTKADGTQDGALFRVGVRADNGQLSSIVYSDPTLAMTVAPTQPSPFGGPVNMPGWQYGLAMPAWLQVDGIEIANWARITEYLRRGLAGSWVTLVQECSCDFLYDVDSSGSPDVFVDPVTDQAPWYDQQRSESKQFLGIFVRGLRIEPQVARSATTIPGRFGGSVIGPAQVGGMRITVDATLISATRSGADYGEEWLRGVLGDPECDTCGTSTVELRNSCPPDDGSDDNLGYWISYRTAVTDGPTMTPDALGVMTDVTWTWTSAEAHLYKPSAPLLPATILDPSDDPTAPCIDFSDWLCGPGAFLGCYPVLPPNKGAWGSIITIRTGRGVGPVQLDIYSTCPPQLGSDLPDSSMLVQGVEPGCTLIIDSSQHAVIHIDAVGNVADGLDHIYVPAGQPLQWLDVRDCDPPRCVCISTPHPCSGGGDTTVSLDIQYRRRG